MCMHAPFHCELVILIALIPAFMHAHSMSRVTHVHSETDSVTCAVTLRLYQKDTVLSEWFKLGKVDDKKNIILCHTSSLNVLILIESMYTDTRTHMHTHRALASCAQSKQYLTPTNQQCWCTQTGFKTVTHTLSSAFCLLTFTHELSASCRKLVYSKSQLSKNWEKQFLSLSLYVGM